MPSGKYERITTDERFWKFVNKTENCWLWTGGINSKGYGNFWMNGKTLLSHRYAFENINGIKPSSSLLHSCDNPKCVNPEHLREGTHQDNMDDKVHRNRCYRPKGILNIQAKITPEIANTIREEYKTNKITQKSLSDKYNICQTTVSQIILNKTWMSI